eukprot:CAMPEP_0206054804 /NCGR_PEP_ID=MMETSP1466-20131121/38888_1 /ASSEMBLY_ACC=CAM_ASM_001126 /TAXON_ID=44452 /ORGANISM="Pavlova gyrans, Strain CCMP608" /LENGTH=246 /DNA_ID=CAMNT_0053430023 /DNA_START=44 /DNA_END=784 /DNA_ORIENTATION=+
MTGTGTSAIICAHDAFGVESGRTKAICDKLAAALGVIVVVPSFFEGGAPPGAASVERMAPGDTAAREAWYTLPWRILLTLISLPRFIGGIRAANWERVRPLLMDHVAPFVRSRGATKLGLLGFCWGGWFTTHASAEPGPAFACAATAHPSLQLCRLYGDDFEALIDGVACPQLFLTSAQEASNVRPGGRAQEVLSSKPFGSACQFVHFKDMKHGWVNRGASDDPAVERDYAQAMDLITRFFRAHLV